MYQGIFSSCLLNNITHLLSVKQYKLSRSNGVLSVAMQTHLNQSLYYVVIIQGAKRNEGKINLATFFNNQRF